MFLSLEPYLSFDVESNIGRLQITVNETSVHEPAPHAVTEYRIAGIFRGGGRGGLTFMSSEFLASLWKNFAWSWYSMCVNAVLFCGKNFVVHLSATKTMKI